MNIVIGILALVVGVFGFSQIIGSLQNLMARPGLVVPLLVWSAILIAGYVLVSRNLAGASKAVLIGYGISFVLVLGQGRIQ